MSSSSTIAVSVAVRIRPFSEKEKNEGCMCVVSVVGNKTIIRDPTGDLILEGSSKGSKPEGPENRELWEREFCFDNSFWSFDLNDPNYSSQLDVFNAYGPWVIDNVWAGYNCSVFAYGQTGAGKTYTMMGGSAGVDEYDRSKIKSFELGFVPRLCDEIFCKISNQLPTSRTTFLVEASYFEIYNEKAFDLLDGKNRVVNGNTGLRIRENPQTGAYLEDLTTIAVNTYEEIEELLKEGSKSRSVASTQMNQQSSRSHGVFQLIVRQITKEEGGEKQTEKQSRIHLVDLAGSERVNNSGVHGKRLKEAQNINKSLATLSDVIMALTKPNSKKISSTFIPYRNSTLTWLLKDSLGGNAKTAIIAAISPSAESYSESLTTLKYAERAKKIINKAKVNEGSSKALISSLTREIEMLKKELAKRNQIFSNVNMESNEVKKLQQKLLAEEKLMETLTCSWEERRHRSEQHMNRLQQQNEELKKKHDKMEAEFESLLREREEKEVRQADIERRRIERHQRHKFQLEVQLRRRKADQSNQICLQKQLAESQAIILGLKGELSAVRNQREEMEESLIVERHKLEEQRMKFGRSFAKERQSIRKKDKEIHKLKEEIKQIQMSAASKMNSRSGKFEDEENSRIESSLKLKMLQQALLQSYDMVHKFVLERKKGYNFDKIQLFQREYDSFGLSNQRGSNILDAIKCSLNSLDELLRKRDAMLVEEMHAFERATGDIKERDNLLKEVFDNIKLTEEKLKASSERTAALESEVKLLADYFHGLERKEKEYTLDKGLKETEKFRSQILLLESQLNGQHEEHKNKINQLLSSFEESKHKLVRTHEIEVTKLNVNLRAIESEKSKILGEMSGAIHDFSLFMKRLQSVGGYDSIYVKGQQGMRNMKETNIEEEKTEYSGQEFEYNIKLMRDEIRNLHDEVDKIVRLEEITRLETEAEKLKMELVSTKRAFTSRETEFEASKQRVEELEEENQKLEKAELELRARAVSLERENEELNTSLLVEKENRISLESSRDKIQSNLKSLQQEHDIQLFNIAELSKQRDSIMVSKQELEEQLSQCKEEMEADRKAFNDIIGNQLLAYDTLTR